MIVIWKKAKYGQDGKSISRVMVATGKGSVAKFALIELALKVTSHTGKWGKLYQRALTAVFGGKWVACSTGFEQEKKKS